MNATASSLILPPDYFQQPDPVFLARDLLGKLLVTTFDGRRTVGRISETEAYKAPEDRACHAYGNRRTARTETMFAAGGVAYVYLCYGIHELFNVVTGPADSAHAVLIRAVEPVAGIEWMLQRRAKEKLTPQLTAGPGVMTVALGITRAYDGQPLTEAKADAVWIQEATEAVPDQQIGVSSRIGVDSAGSCAARPWRFFLRDNPYVSRKR